MNQRILDEWVVARNERRACVLVTLAATQGSVPREAGAKMLVYGDGTISGTIGGGKFEALVVHDALAALRAGESTLLRSYPLHEHHPESFGAICGGEVTVLIEPQISAEALFIVGAGHCARALARLAEDCGWQVTVHDERTDLLAGFPARQRIAQPDAAAFIAGRTWKPNEALVLLSRNHELDREALYAAIQTGGMGYLGMIGSRRKVRQIYTALEERGIGAAQLQAVFAPVGLDLGAESPAEIAVSVMAEILATLRGKGGGHLRSATGHA